MGTAVDTLVAKLATVSVRAHLRATPRGISRVRAHDREWDFAKGDTVTLKGSGGMIRGKVIQLVENPSEGAFGKTTSIGDNLAVRNPDVGGLTYTPGTQKYRVQWNDRRVGLYSSNELRAVTPGRGGTDITEAMRKRNADDARTRSRRLLYRLRQNLD